MFRFADDHPRSQGGSKPPAFATLCEAVRIAGIAPRSRSHYIDSFSRHRAPLHRRAPRRLFFAVAGTDLAGFFLSSTNALGRDSGLSGDNARNATPPGNFLSTDYAGGFLYGRVSAAEQCYSNSAQTIVWSEAPGTLRGAKSISATWQRSASTPVARIWSMRHPKFRSKALRKKSQ